MNEYVTIGRHLLSTGSGTCDVSNLILQADIQRAEHGNIRASEMLMNAARDVLHHRALARRRAAMLIAKSNSRRKK